MTMASLPERALSYPDAMVTEHGYLFLETNGKVVEDWIVERASVVVVVGGYRGR